MKSYLDLANKILMNGKRRADRTGTGTIGLFGEQIYFDLTAGFPLLTTKRVFTRGIFAELLWMLAGDTNARTLSEQGVHIWDGWADPDTGELGPIYGEQWRSWFGGIDSKPIDQIQMLIDGIRKDPFGRRHIVTAWNPAEIPDMALPPCHCLFQFYVDGDFLSCQLYQRSADLFLGVPFNIASYALLTHMVAQVTGYMPGEFIHTFGDVHIYTNHVKQVREQLRRTIRQPPKLELNPDVDNVFDFTLDDIKVVGYNPHPALKGEVSI